MKAESESKAAMSDKSAAESAYGFMRQLDRMFLWLLLKAEPDATVSFEWVDDVGVTYPNGKVLAEQDKSFVAEDSNPLRNRSEALWKTLSNWIEECIAGRLEAATTQFLLWLSAPCKPGTWANSLFEADSSDQADAFVALVDADLKASGDQDKADDVYKYIRKCLGYYQSHQTIVRTVVTRATREHGSGSAAADLKSAFQQRYDVFYAAFGEDIIAHGKAWIDAEIKTSAEQRRPARIRVADLRRRMEEKIIALRNRSILPDVQKPSRQEIDGELRALPTYIRQLELIEECQDEMLDAAAVYLRSSLQRTIWADSSFWDEDSWDDLASNILSDYRAERTRAQMLPGLADTARGKYVYHGCKQSCATLARPWTPEFVRGCLHTLANAPKLGWHPCYEALLERSEAT